MADWSVDEIVACLRAMKPYESADILAAMMGLRKRGDADYAAKAKEVQLALGR
jgi:hypothetical protein